MFGVKILRDSWMSLWSWKFERLLQILILRIQYLVFMDRMFCSYKLQVQFKLETSIFFFSWYVNHWLSLPLDYLRDLCSKFKIVVLLIFHPFSSSPNILIIHWVYLCIISSHTYMTCVQYFKIVVLLILCILFIF